MIYKQIEAIEKRISETTSLINSLKDSSSRDGSLNNFYLNQLIERLDELNNRKNALISNSGKEVITLRIIGDKTKHGKIPSKLLSKILKEFQDLTENVAYSIARMESGAKRLPFNVKQLSELSVAEVFQGSFGIVLENQLPEQEKMNSEILNDKIFDKIIEMTTFGSKGDKFEVICRSLGLQAMKNYSNLIKEFSSEEMEFEITFTNHLQEVKKRIVTQNDIQMINKNLNEMTWVNEEEISVIATLTGLNVEKMEFESTLMIQKKKESIKGYIDDILIKKVIENKMLDSKCKFLLAKQIEANLITHKETVKWKLKNIEETHQQLN